MMTIEIIKRAIEGGKPFELRMADGREYHVPHQDHISVAPSGLFVIVFDDRGGFSALPLFTMTGLNAKVIDHR